MSLVKRHKHSQPLTQVPLVEQQKSSQPPLQVPIGRANNPQQIKQAYTDVHFNIRT